jgi:hypothetical protein
MTSMSNMSDNSSSISREQVIRAYLNAMQLIDDRVTPLLGKATTRVLVQGAARRVTDSYPFLHFLITMPYTEVVPAVIREQLSGVTSEELAAGLDTLLQECFAGLEELTGNLIAPPLHAEVMRQLEQMP